MYNIKWIKFTSKIRTKSSRPNIAQLLDPKTCILRRLKKPNNLNKPNQNKKQVTRIVRSHLSFDQAILIMILNQFQYHYRCTTRTHLRTLQLGSVDNEITNSQQKHAIRHLNTSHSYICINSPSKFFLTRNTYSIYIWLYRVTTLLAGI